MKAGQYVAPNQVVVSHVDRPDIKEGEALIQVSHAGICGTDMMIFLGKHPRAKAPVTMGHEFSGVIADVKGVTAFKQGDHVVVEPTISCGQCDACKSGTPHVCEQLKLIGIDMDGGFAEYVRVPINRLHAVPEELSMSLAALAEPVAVAVHTVRRSSLKVGQNVAILGAGPIGLLVGLVAKMNGARNVFISDISPFRLEKATALGFYAINSKKTDAVEAILSQTNSKPMDVVFEVAGTQNTVDQMIPLIKTQGEIMVVSVFKNKPMLALADMHFRELSLTTTRCYSGDDFKTAIDIMAADKVDFSSVISHELELEDIAKGFELMQNPDESLKILIKQ